MCSGILLEGLLGENKHLEVKLVCFTIRMFGHSVVIPMAFLIAECGRSVNWVR